ncbi:MAG: ammonium transporter [Alteromonadaceae bacterium]|uniref:Rh family protein/ammonium transporter n=2 Tax=Paraglaciecola mesophila TaxID=197222 RepID=K6Z0U9_9ALTE|nr:ammonium transporter [Paraglaciecola mesophila]MAD18538.1 ammonium transporter [Alteromonadaceae bacterium]MBB18982.1 ammonium transporter [Rickettsiales bacterium]GAC22623.1 rh family protein/ammonium transporter [Paraglaciecola mesophila KMM 241]|tara:strand:+ start:9267 stop:10475 length:1209 start_codon:yes stop_codon:yes gene_type:complete
MQDVTSATELLVQSSNTYFLLIGAIMVFAMHAGFAFLEVGTVRHKNQVNALVKIITDFGVSCVAYFFIGYWVAYDTTFYSSASELTANNGYDLVKFFFLMTFAAAIPAIISGGIAERAKFNPFLLASAVIVALVYPFFEGIVWNGNYGVQDWIEQTTGAPFHDFAGSVVVHGIGGWLALVAVYFLGLRNGRVKDKKLIAFAPSNIPFLALGTWILCIGWFGFNVMSAQTLDGISGLVAMNSLMAMAGGIIAAWLFGKNDPGFVHNGPLAGLVAICAGSDIVHPIGALAIGVVAGWLFVTLFTFVQKSKKLDDVLGVWPLHGLCGAWGGIAAGIFGSESLGGLGGVSITAQVIGTIGGILVALIGGVIVYGLINTITGLRLTEEEEYNGADLTIHRIGSTNDD